MTIIITFEKIPRILVVNFTAIPTTLAHMHHQQVEFLHFDFDFVQELAFSCEPLRTVLWFFFYFVSVEIGNSGSLNEWLCSFFHWFLLFGLCLGHIATTNHSEQHLSDNKSRRDCLLDLRSNGIRNRDQNVRERETDDKWEKKPQSHLKCLTLQLATETQNRINTAFCHVMNAWLRLLI